MFVCSNKLISLNEENTSKFSNHSSKNLACISKCDVEIQSTEKVVSSVRRQVSFKLSSKSQFFTSTFLRKTTLKKLQKIQYVKCIVVALTALKVIAYLLLLS